MIELTPTLIETADNPLYIQLYKYIKDEISAGLIPAGTRLPSIRKLSTYLKISRNTVETAYQQLIAEGYVESRPRKGLYVIEVETPIVTPKPKHPCLFLEPSESQQSYRYDFRQGNIDLEHFPFQIWRKLTNHCLRYEEKELFRYGDRQGEAELRLEIVKYLYQSRGVTCTPEQIIIGAGIQQLLQLLSLLIGLYGKRIAVEEPGYDGAKAVFMHHGALVQPIPLEESGIHLPSLYKSKAKVVYVTPSHQFPCGMIMPFSKRMQLLHWAESQNGLIIEDDYDGEFRYRGKPIPSLQGLNLSNKVVYLGTFSKSFLPSIRISYMVLPPDLLIRYKQNFQLYDQPVSRIHQKTLQLFMEQGYWERHIRKMRTIYQRKHLALISAIQEIMGEKVSIIGQDSGLHILISLFHDLSEAELIKKAAEKGVKVYPTSRYWSDPSKIEQPMIQLGFGGLQEEEIWEGIQLLNQAWF